MPKLLFIGLHLLLFAALTALYVDLISPLYTYYTFYTVLSTGKLVAGACLTAAVGLLVPAHVLRPSDFLMWILYGLTLLPSMVIYGCQDRSTAYAIMLSASYVVVDLVRRFRFTVSLPQGFDRAVVYFSIATVGVALLAVITVGGLSYFNLNFDEVYNFRTAIDEDVFGAHRGSVYGFSLLSYLTSVAFDVCNMFLMAFFLHHRRMAMAAISIAVQVLYFGISSQKSYAYSILYPLYFYAFGDRARSYLLFIFGITMVIFASIIEWVSWDSYFVSGSILGRALYLPAILNFSYHDIFTDIGFVYLSNSRFNPFSNYSYGLDATYLVGWIVFGNPNANANNGFLATSYMHFGYPGMLVYSAVVGLLLAFVDALSRQKEDIWVRVSIVLSLTSLLRSADLTTSLLSHGVLVSIVMCWLYSGQLGSQLVSPRRNVNNVLSMQRTRDAP